jgi:hypothetical protein
VQNVYTDEITESLVATNSTLLLQNYHYHPRKNNFLPQKAAFGTYKAMNGTYLSLLREKRTFFGLGNFLLLRSGDGEKVYFCVFIRKKYRYFADDDGNGYRNIFQADNFCIFVVLFFLKSVFSKYIHTTMTDQELKDLVAQLALDTQAFKAQLAASQEQADKRAAEAARDTKELKQQIGGLGNKFGSFTEGLLLPSVERMLAEQFGVTDFTMRMKSRRGTEWQELDGFGFANGDKNIGFIVEVKSHLDERSIAQTLRQLERFGTFHPHYKSMTLYGIIAAVDAISATMRQAVYDAGLYLVTVHDDVAEMPTPPQGFVPFSTIV